MAVIFQQVIDGLFEIHVVMCFQKGDGVAPGAFVVIVVAGAALDHDVRHFSEGVIITFGFHLVAKRSE